MTTATQNGSSRKTDQGKTPDGAASDYRFPASRKVYTAGTLHPDLRVPHREISLSPTRDQMTGVLEANAPVRVYDTSGPYTDPDANIDIRQGLASLREPWIAGRADVTYTQAEASYRPVAGHSDPNLPLPPKRLARRGSGLVTQMQQARAGIITTGNGIYRPPGEPGARPFAVRRPAPRPVVRRSHSRSHHARIRPLGSRRAGGPSSLSTSTIPNASR